MATLQQAGFPLTAGKRRAAPQFDLWALATAHPLDEAGLRALAGQHFPA